jgi:D-alanyl-D-alanine carboxypeptidase
MKQFIFLVLGGLGAIATGVILAFLIHAGWLKFGPYVKTFVQRIETAVTTQTIETETENDASSISDSRKTIRYTASEEEGLVNAVNEALSEKRGNQISANSYIVKNVSTERVYTSLEQDRIVPIASLTKLATAVVARKLIDPDERVTISSAIMKTYGNTALFEVGETFRAGDLLYPLLMVSSNDAAESLAQGYGRKKFIQAMNDWAQSIGAYRTYFVDPSGLSRYNISSAGDLALMIDWIRIHDPELLAITTLKTKTVRSHTWENPTHFLSWSYYSGGKNGYTTEANRTGVSLFTLGKDKNMYAVVVLGSSDRDGDVVKLLGKVAE